jgi:hypothetical protein
LLAVEEITILIVIELLWKLTFSLEINSTQNIT